MEKPRDYSVFWEYPPNLEAIKEAIQEWRAEQEEEYRKMEAEYEDLPVEDLLSEV